MTDHKLLVNLLEVQLDIHPCDFAVNGHGFLFFDGEEIPQDVVASLNPERFDYMIDWLIAAAIKLKGIKAKKAAA